MAGFFATIGHNLAHVFHFSGRQTRGRFWPYALFLFCLSIVAGMLLMIPPMVDFFIRIQRYAIEHPEGLPLDSKPLGPGAPIFPPELMPDFSGMMAAMVLVNLLFVLLLAAAVVRRLHDCDRTGLWALMPLPFMIVGQVYAPQATAMFTGSAATGSMVRLLALNNLCYWMAVIALIIFLVQEGTNGPNRFGPNPQGEPPRN